jgi:hypothetical protein
MPAARKRALTTPDLVLLSLLVERPMHGYEANQELVRREVQDWAGVSRPQVYYSLEKLALADALEREDWTTQRDRPAFLTWMALSWQAKPGVFARQLARRRAFLEKEVVREEATLDSIRAEVGHQFHEAVWMVSLMIEQFRAELRWLDRLSREVHLRAPARHPWRAPQNL